MTVNNNKNKHIRTGTRLTGTQRSDGLERLIEVNDNGSIYVALDGGSLSQGGSGSTETIKEGLDSSEKINEINESLKEIKDKETISNVLKEEFFTKLKEIIKTIENNSGTNFEIDYDALKEIIKSGNTESISDSGLINSINQLKLSLNALMTKEQGEEMIRVLGYLDTHRELDSIEYSFREANSLLRSLNDKEEIDYTTLLNDIIDGIKKIQFTTNVELDSSSIVKVEEAQKISNGILTSLSEKITELNFILANNQGGSGGNSPDYSGYLKKLVNRLTPLEQKGYYKRYEIYTNQNDQKNFRLYFDKNNDIPFTKQYRNIKLSYSGYNIQAHSGNRSVEFDANNIGRIKTKALDSREYSEGVFFDSTGSSGERRKSEDLLLEKSYRVPPRQPLSNDGLEDSNTFDETILNGDILEIRCFPTYSSNCWLKLEFEAFELYEEYQKEV